jgi:hypothetical protein
MVATDILNALTKAPFQGLLLYPFSFTSLAKQDRIAIIPSSIGLFGIWQQRISQYDIISISR